MPATGRLLLAGALLTALAKPSVARADDEAARVAFRHGVELYDKKAYAQALEAFQTAYREKPSPGIKQNVALCLEGLGDPVGAATAFDEALDEGATTLKPETKAAIQSELDKLTTTVATITLKVVALPNRHPIDGATIFVDDRPLSAAAAHRPIRVRPGVHDFRAHAEGFADAPVKHLALVAGSPVDATFELGAAFGTLSVVPSVAGAVVKVDGVEVGHGAWSGKLAAGPHHVEVTAPGYLASASDVVVTASAAVDYAVALRTPADAPPPYAPDGPPPRPPPPKRIFVAVMFGASFEKLRLSEDVGEDPGGGSHDLNGLSFAARGGYKFSRLFAAELLLEIAGLGSTYTIHPADTVEAKSSATVLQMAPALRFSTPGRARFTAAAGVGLHSTSLSTTFPTPGGTTTHNGSGLAFSGAFDLGFQFDVGPIFLEPAVAFDVNGVGVVRDSATGDRMILDSPGLRTTFRLALGIPL